MGSDSSAGASGAHTAVPGRGALPTAGLATNVSGAGAVTEPVLLCQWSGGNQQQRGTTTTASATASAPAPAPASGASAAPHLSSATASTVHGFRPAAIPRGCAVALACDDGDENVGVGLPLAPGALAHLDLVVRVEKGIRCVGSGSWARVCVLSRSTFTHRASRVHTTMATHPSLQCRRGDIDVRTR